MWGVISLKSNLELFHPYCKKNNLIIWNENDSVDELEYLNGRKMIRRFVSWKEGIGYDLFINQLKKPSSFVSWRISKSNEGFQISITVYPYLFNQKNKIASFIPFYVLVHPMLKSYLNSVVSGLEFYMSSGNPVKKNNLVNIYGSLNNLILLSFLFFYKQSRFNL